jgi:hypothetical protein
MIEQELTKEYQKPAEKANVTGSRGSRIKGLMLSITNTNNGARVLSVSQDLSTKLAQAGYTKVRLVQFNYLEESLLVFGPEKGVELSYASESQLKIGKKKWIEAICKDAKINTPVDTKVIIELTKAPKEHDGEAAFILRTETQRIDPDYKPTTRAGKAKPDGRETLELKHTI